MTLLPEKTEKKLGLVIDLDTCVGCHACVISCKGWNTENYGAPLSDENAFGAEPVGSFLNRVHSYEITPADKPAHLVHFPKSCLHCDNAPCVTVCPTGASYKRVEDGIVLVNESDCIGCGLCAWACPYGAREMDPVEKVMKKCTLCVDRIYNENLPESEYFKKQRNYFIKKANDYGFTVIDMKSVFAEHYKNNKKRFEFSNDAHWNSLGHKLVTDEIAKNLNLKLKSK